MFDKLMYIPNDDTQNYTKLVAETYGHIKSIYLTVLVLNSNLQLKIYMCVD